MYRRKQISIEPVEVSEGSLLCMFCEFFLFRNVTLWALRTELLTYRALWDAKSKTVLCSLRFWSVVTGRGDMGKAVSPSDSVSVPGLT